MLQAVAVAPGTSDSPGWEWSNATSEGTRAGEEPQD